MPNFVNAICCQIPPESLNPTARPFLVSVSTSGNVANVSFDTRPPLRGCELGRDVEAAVSSAPGHGWPQAKTMLQVVFYTFCAIARGRTS